MKQPRQKSLRFALISNIVITGLVGLVLVLINGYVNRKLTNENHEAALSEVLQVAITDRLDQLDELARELGLSLQRDAELRRAIADKDAVAVVARLDNQYHQYFVTAGVTKLSKLYAFDETGKLIGQSSEGIPTAKGTVLCPAVQTALIGRKGADRIKIISQLCAVSGGAYHATIVPVGSLKPIGYLQVVVDPAYGLTTMPRSVAMPIRISYPDGSVAFQSEHWPRTVDRDQYLLADARVTGESGELVLRVEAVRDIALLREKLADTNQIMMAISVATIALFIGVALVRMRSCLGPLRDLKSAAESLQRGQFCPITRTPYPELDVPMLSFNAMAQEITQLIARLEGEIKERKQIEAELLRHRRDLEAARDQAFAASRAKSAFLANMSHELRTPLNAIIGYSEIMMEEAKANQLEGFSRDLKKVTSAAKHLLSLIGEVLDLSKIEAGKMELHVETFRVPEFVADVIDVVKPLADKNGNQLEVACPDNIGTMCSDPIKLQQALFNLLSNACKFTREGRVRLDVKRDSRNGIDWLRFIVSDTGIGISDSQMRRLFTEFTQGDDSTTRKYGGTGLGLVLSQRYCQMMGGYITVASEKGKGSTFAIFLPAVSPAAKLLAQASAGGGPPGTSGR